MIKFLLFILVSFFQWQVWSSETYIVKKSDCISQVAYKFCQKVYGTSGFIRQIKLLNPELSFKADMVLPNTAIKIPDPSLCVLPWRSQTPVESVPVSAEAETPVKSVASEIQLPDHYFVSLYTFYKILASNSLKAPLINRNIDASITSRPALGFQAGYRYSMSQKFDQVFTYDFHTEDYYGFQNLKIHSQSLVRSRFDYGFNTTFANSNWLQFGAGVEERTIFDQSTDTQINLNKVLTPYLKSSYGFLILENQNLRTHVLAKARYLSEARSGSLKTHAAFEYGIGINFSLLGRMKNSLFGLDYNQAQQSTSVTTQSEKRIGVSWMIEFEAL